MSSLALRERDREGGLYREFPYIMGKKKDGFYIYFRVKKCFAVLNR
jgi:hypothetical protein